jgi:hypothetical protein
MEFAKPIVISVMEGINGNMTCFFIYSIYYNRSHKCKIARRMQAESRRLKVVPDQRPIECLT